MQDAGVHIAFEIDPAWRLYARIQEVPLLLAYDPVATPEALIFLPGFSDALGRSIRFMRSTTPVPIFIDIPPALAHAPWEATIAQTLTAYGLIRTNFQVIRRVSRADSSSSPALPLLPPRLWASARRGEFIGPRFDEAWAALIGGQQAPSERLADFLLPGRSHLVIASDEDAPAYFRALSALASQRPNLLIVLSASQTPRLPLVEPAWPTGLSVLVIPDAVALRAALQEAVFRLSNGLLRSGEAGLHEAVTSVWLWARSAFEPVLFSDPASNRALSISALAEALRAKLEAVAAPVLRPAGRPSGMPSRVQSQPTLSTVRPRGLNPAPESAPAPGAAPPPPPPPPPYPAGIGPPMDRGPNPAGGGGAPYPPSVTRPGAVAEPPGRRADVSLYRAEPGTAGWVSKDHCLQQGARYWVRVLLGALQPGSLMAAPPPPIDPLLPPPESAGYELTVLVNGEDFALLGEPAVRLHLPPQGPSAPVDVLVRAPARPGPARLYLALAYRGNTLQSFVLDADIAAEEAMRPGESTLLVRLLFSNTARFDNLASLKPRALSIGVGDPRPGAPSPLRLSAATSSVSLRFSELMTAEQITGYRRLLEEATFGPDHKPRFLSYPSPSIPQRPGVEDVLRRLARLGSSLYRGFYLQADTVAPALDALLTSEDQTIQILRHNATQTFPWAALYDYPEPEELAGKPAPVCLGYRPSGAPGAAPERCSCPSPDTWCARGFWGVRHQIEELVGTGILEDAVVSVARNAASPGPVGLVLGTHDKPVDEMRARVNGLLSPESALDFDLEENLLPALWKPDRPAILVLLGHMAVAAVEGEPEGPRIVLRPGQRFLQDKKVIDYRRVKGRWAAPRSVVMVLACTAGATAPATVTDFMLAFHNAGAGAVIGTECTVFSGLLSRFAAECTGALVEGVSLGAAVTGFRRRLLEEKNPLGFVFNAIGNADLTLERT